MQISSRSDYAVRALLELALLPSGESLPLADVAARTNIPFKYLERIFHCATPICCVPGAATRAATLSPGPPRRSPSAR